MSAVSSVIEKPGYSKLTTDANGFQTSRAQFEKTLMAVWNSTTVRTIDYTLVSPTEIELQRLYEAITPENGDPAASNGFLASIFVHQLFLESPTDSRWSAYIQAKKDFASDVGDADSLEVVQNIEQALSGKIVPNVIKQQFEAIPAVKDQIIGPDGEVVKLPAAAGLPSISSEQSSLIELYIGYFNRAPEAQGLQFWEGELTRKLDSGLSIDDSLSEIANQFWPAAQNFYDITGYEPGMSDFDFVGKVYSNVLGRPDAIVTDKEGINFWVDQIKSGAIESRGEFIVKLINGAHSYVKSFPDDPVSIFVDNYLSNRIQVSSLFAQEEYSGHLSGDSAVKAGVKVLSSIDDTAASVQQMVNQIVEGEIFLVGINSEALYV